MLNKIIILLILVIIAYFSYSLWLGDKQHNLKDGGLVATKGANINDGIEYISGPDAVKNLNNVPPVDPKLPIKQVVDYSKQAKNYTVVEGGKVFIANDGSLIESAVSKVVPDNNFAMQALEIEKQQAMEAAKLKAQQEAAKLAEATKIEATRMEATRMEEIKQLEIAEQVALQQQEEKLKAEQEIAKQQAMMEEAAQQAKMAEEAKLAEQNVATKQTMAKPAISKPVDAEVQKAILQLYPARHFMMGMSDYESFIPSKNAKIDDKSGITTFAKKEAVKVADTKTALVEEKEMQKPEAEEPKPVAVKLKAEEPKPVAVKLKAEEPKSVEVKKPKVVKPTPKIVVKAEPKPTKPLEIKPPVVTKKKVVKKPVRKRVYKPKNTFDANSNVDIDVNSLFAN